MSISRVIISCLPTKGAQPQEGLVRVRSIGKRVPIRKEEELGGDLADHGAPHVVLNGVHRLGAQAENAAVPALEAAGRRPAIPEEGEVRHSNAWR